MELSGSMVEAATSALLTIVAEPSRSTVTVIVYCVDAPAAIVPSVQVGTPLGSSAQPAVTGSVVPAGRVSVTTTFWASEGPLLVTVRV